MNLHREHPIGCRIDRQRRSSGQCLAETISGSIALTMIGMFLIDLFAVYAGATICDELAKREARVAAGKMTRLEAQAAIEQVASSFPVAGIVTGIRKPWIVPSNSGSNGVVRVHTEISIKLPVSVPFQDDWSRMSFVREAEEPVVALEASAAGVGAAGPGAGEAGAAGAGAASAGGAEAGAAGAGTAGSDSAASGGSAGMAGAASSGRLF